MVTIHYEDLAADPRAVLERVVVHAGEDVEAGALDSAAATIQATSVGKWESALSRNDLSLLMPIVGPTLDRIGVER